MRSTGGQGREGWVPSTRRARNTLWRGQCSQSRGECRETAAGEEGALCRALGGNVRDPGAEPHTKVWPRLVVLGGCTSFS